MKNPNCWLLVLFLLHALVPRNSSANPIEAVDISILTERDGNSLSPTEPSSTEPIEIIQIKQRIQSVLSGNFSHLTQSETTEIQQAVLLSVLSGRILSPAEQAALIQFQQRIEELKMGNFSSLTENDAKEAMKVVLQTVLSGNCSSQTEKDLKGIMQKVLSGDFSSPTGNDVTFQFKQKIQAVMTRNFSSLTEKYETEVMAALFQSVLTGHMSNSTENNAMIRAKQKMESVMSGNYSSLMEDGNNVMEFVEVILDEMLTRNITEEEEKDFLTPVTTNSSTTLNAFLNGTRIVIEMIDSLKGRVNDTDFDVMVKKMEDHLVGLDARLAPDRVVILRLLYDSRNSIVNTKNTLLTAAHKLKLHCEHIIFLYAKNKGLPKDEELQFIKYTIKKFMKYATFVKGMLVEAEKELKKTQILLSDCQAKIIDMEARLNSEEKLLGIQLKEDRANLKALEERLSSLRKGQTETSVKQDNVDKNIRRTAAYLSVVVPAAGLFGEAAVYFARNRERETVTRTIYDEKAIMTQTMLVNKKIASIALKSLTVTSVFNSKEASQEVRSAVEAMSIFLQKEISLIQFWKITMQNTLDNKWDSDEFIKWEGSTSIVKSLKDVIYACDKYMGHKLPEFLKSKSPSS